MPWGDYRPKAFAGEVVPFRVTAFREGHDLHRRPCAPHLAVRRRVAAPADALDDGFDRWETDVALLEQGVWRFRFEAFGDDFATWEHAADLKIAAGVDAALMRELGALLFDRAAAEKSRPDRASGARSTAAAAPLRDAHVDDDAALAIVARPGDRRVLPSAAR